KVLELARANSEKLIVILNTCNNMNLSFLDTYDVDAAISVGTTGQSGVHAIPKILSGEITPSGKTTATQPYDLKYDPTFWNSGRRGGEKGYQVYQEGIYVGYKWYETADAEGYWDGYQRTLSDGTVLEGYDAVVQYPFGFGLSYTDFKWEIEDISLAPNGNITKDLNEITVKVRVTNVGTVPGKDVVQLYYTPPYRKGGIEKAAINLVAFAKTVTLKPANMTENGLPESQVVELTFTPYDMASYDCYDKNFNRNVGYEMDSGEYIMRLSNTAHDLDDCEGAQWSYFVNGTIKFRNDPVSGNRVTNRFTNYDTVEKNENGEFVTINNKAYADCAIDGSDADQADVVYLSRANFAGTFPTKTAEKRTGAKVTAAKKYVAPIPEVETAPTQNEKNGLLLVTAEDGSALSLSQLKNGSTSYKVNEELVLDLGLNYDSPTWDKLLNQLSKDEIYTLVSKGSYSNAAVASIGKPILYDSDGPAGLNRHIISSGVDRTEWTMYVMPNVLAQSWNAHLSYSFGLSVGKEAILTGNKGW
ncbi:MAG: glycoside hydrolase family 3 C-terminal domain-containing protein, partial [Clostridia bacterium]|nr:glycoside hydrolase family 3 C-terminal domain-containing protein [Clostridia bacterium]